MKKKRLDNAHADEPSLEKTHSACPSPRKDGKGEHALLHRLIDIGIALSAERNTTRLMERILGDAQDIANADGGTLYLLSHDGGEDRLDFAILRNNSLNLTLGGAAATAVALPSLPLHDAKTHEPNHKNISTHVALTGRLVNIQDAYKCEDFDFSGVAAFDKRMGYRTQSVLAAPLINHEGDTIGVLQLINARDPETGRTIAFAEGMEPIIKAMASYAAVAFDNQMLFQGQKDLLDAFFRCIARTIDAKSRHTSAHGERVPILTEMLTQAACDAADGPLKDFHLNAEEFNELRIAAWLHDCGKLATPDHILSKPTKLCVVHDSIETIECRFEILKRDAETDFLCKLAEQPGEKHALEAEQKARIARLDDDFKFIVRSNSGNSPMTAEDKSRIRDIARLTWRNRFGEEKPLLTDKEARDLCTERGTLTDEERNIINNHVTVTIQMLESLPFPRNMRRVAEYAGAHHEKIDGTGYPRGLKREQMPVPARIIAVADIFEALTGERPYKKPMKLSQALGILQHMKNGKHIDADLYELFLKAGVWRKYAEQHLDPEQIDVSDITPYL